MGVEVAVGETPSLTGEFTGETHRGLECTQTHSLGKQHQKGPPCLWVAEEVTENRQSGASAIATYQILPPHTALQSSHEHYLALVNT